MSRSNPNEDVNLVNPAKFFLEWKGKTGRFEYWDKASKTNVDVPLPFTFIPLCTLATLKGYNKKKEISFWSNEVKDIAKDRFVIKGKAKGGSIETHFEGLYKDLKDKLELNKINYVQSVYIAHKPKGGSLELANIQIKTSALGPWIEFGKKNNINECGVSVKGFTKEINGDVSFVAPIYTPIKISDETNAAAIDLDKELQAYLTAYLEKNKTSVDSFETKSEPKADQPKQENKPAEKGDLPWENKEANGIVTSNDDDEQEPF